jgi:hypothetical protein
MSESTREIMLGPMPKSQRARLRFSGVRHANESFEVLAFLDLPPSRAASAGRDDPSFVGSFTMYGLGQPQFASEAQPATAPWDAYIDIPAGSPILTAAAAAPGHRLTLMLEGPDGKKLSPDTLRFDYVAVEPH